MAEEKLKEYAGLYAKAYTYLKDMLGEVADEEAIHYGASAVLAEVVSYLKSERVEVKSKDELATRKQKHALYSFGLSYVPENLTKKEASEILSRLTSANREEVSRIIKELNEKYKRQE